MARELETVERRIVSLLTPELSDRVRGMRMRWALWEAGCLLSNSDHGPWGADYLMPRIDVERARVFTGTRENGSYNHHPQLTRFKGTCYYAFANAAIDEESEGQGIMLSTSEGGRQWTPPTCIVPGDAEEGIVRNCPGIYANDEVIVIYCWSERAIQDATVPGMRRTAEGSHTIDAYTSRDGENWTLEGEDIIPGCGYCTMMEGPRPTREGALLAAGAHEAHGAVAYLWDAAAPAGKPEIAPLPRSPGDPSFPHDVGETSWYQTDDGVIIMFWRDECGSGYLLVSTSRDGGRTWTAPTLSDVPDSQSRVRAGRLPDGRFFLIGNSYAKLLDRTHLMISISEDGYKFDKMYTLLDDPTAQRTKGLLKCHGYQYPCSLVDGDRLLIGYSVNKEDIECGIVELALLS